MSRYTKKADALFRDLKDRLEIRGYAVVESRDSEGFPKFVIDVDQLSITIDAADMVSKDIFGNSLKAYSPHEIAISYVDGYAIADYSKILLETFKMGVDKVTIKSGADLATAEAAAGEVFYSDFRFPTSGV